MIAESVDRLISLVVLGHSNAARAVLANELIGKPFFPVPVVSWFNEFGVILLYPSYRVTIVMLLWIKIDCFQQLQIDNNNVTPASVQSHWKAVRIRHTSHCLTGKPSCVTQSWQYYLMNVISVFYQGRVLPFRVLPFRAQGSCSRSSLTKIW